MINDFFNIMLPQACLIVFIFGLLLLGMFLSPRFSKHARIITLLGITLSAIFLGSVQTEPQYFGFRKALMSDYYTQLFHFIILICGFFTVILTKKLVNNIKQHACTFYAILLSALLGAINIVSANDFLTLFISIELLSFSTYFLISVKNGYYSKEASFKYLITSAVSTGIFLFGVSYLYGLTSSLDFSSITEIMDAEKEPSLLYTFSCLMIIFGLISKLSIFPFANWVIDVYKGTESSILAFLSTIPKLAMFGIVCRLLVFPLSYSFEVAVVIAVISILTAFWANTYAIREKNIKVILACSSSANASYMLLVACLVSVYNLSTVIFYLICYVIMNISVFSYVNAAEYQGIGCEIEDFKGLFHENHRTTFAYVISIIGLSGLPITSGFVAKIYLFSAIVNSGLIFFPILVILLWLTVIALFYYIKLIKPLFDKTDNKIKLLKMCYSEKFVLQITAIITIMIGIFPGKIIELCRFIAYNI